MAKADPTSAKLKLLKALQAGEPVPNAVKLLRESLADLSNRVVARAAEIIAEKADESYVEEMKRAYERLTVDPLVDDPGCLGKTTLIRALVALEYTDAELFRAGIEYRQIEPVWGDEVDSAAELRGMSAIGLINSVSRAEVLNRCAVLLTDKYSATRVGAARAVGALAIPEGAALLRLKLLTGDADSEVLGECCSALLRLDRTDGAKFVIDLLASPQGDLCVQAGLALGELRITEAFEPLKLAWHRQRDPYVCRSLLLCIGLLRTDDAREFLFSLIDRQNLAAAGDAIKTLHVVGGTSDELKQRIAAAVDAIGDAQLKRIFVEEWRDREIDL
jgi:hypothetical protein